MALGNVFKLTREKLKNRKIVRIKKKNKYDTALKAKRNLKIKRNAFNALLEKKKKNLIS